MNYIAQLSNFSALGPVPVAQVNVSMALKMLCNGNFTTADQIVDALKAIPGFISALETLVRDALDADRAVPLFMLIEIQSVINDSV